MPKRIPSSEFIAILLMREIIFKNQFQKDVERIKRTGRPMERLAEAIDLLRIAIHPQ